MFNKLQFCMKCVQGKQHRNTFPKGSSLRHFLTFIDEKSRYTWVYFLKSKDQVFEKFLEWKAQVEKSYEIKVKTLRTDNGGENT